MTKRLFALEFALLVGLGSVVVLPKSDQQGRAGLRLFLPEFVGEWYGRDQPVSQAERESLGPDTQFARKSYTNARGDEIFVSIVLSGPDMNTSIHRPERCLPAQGWTIADSQTTRVDTPAGPLPLTRLHNVRNIRAQNGKPVSVYNLNYYWFVGSNETTPSHLRRTFIDIRDRLLHGTNQRWAYVTVAANVTSGLTRFGRNEAETDAFMRQFIAEIVPHLQTGGTALAETR